MSAFSARRSDQFVDTRLDPRRPWAEDLFLRIPAGVEVCVRNDLSSITSYVLAEQEDWFEPELAFLRGWLAPGMTAIDVGANHGVFALTMARLVGADGRVLAFEPGLEPQGLLERSIARNGLANLDLVRAAVGDMCGQASLYDGNGSSEAASLAAGNGRPGRQVRVTTLDAEWERLGCPPVDFLKIDVEGFEAQVIAGAGRLLRNASPLVMFEISGQRDRLAELAPRLDALGYAIYRLLPGPGVLVPAVAEEISGFQLNLFAVKPDTAAGLADTGRLLPAVGPVPAVEPEQALAGFAALSCWGSAEDLALRRHMCEVGGDLLALAWRSRHGHPRRAVADMHKVAREPGRSAAAGLDLPLLCSLARCAADIGWRERALSALGEIQALLDRGRDAGDLPFLPLVARFDALAADGEREEWLRVMAADALITLHCHSTRFTRGEAIAVLDRWRHSRFFGPHLERRRQLLSVRLGLQAGLVRTEALRGTRGLNDHLLQ